MEDSLALVSQLESEELGKQGNPNYHVTVVLLKFIIIIYIDQELEQRVQVHLI